MKRLLTLLLATVAAVLMSASAFAAISGTPHDFIGKIVYGRCGVCHVPHAAQGTKRLWRVAPTSGLSGWAGSSVGQLCYGCHGDLYLLGGVKVANAGGSLENTYSAAQGPFSTSAHGRDIPTLTGTLTGTNPGKPYMGAGFTSIECTSCHNVHFEGDFSVAANYVKRPFLRTANTTVSAFCAECHTDRLNNNTLAAANGTGNHPVNIAYNGAVNNTILATPAAALDTRIAGLSAWSLGGKFQDSAGLYVLKTAGAIGNTNQIGCQTCHAVHGKADGTFAGGVDQSNHLLAINNTGAATYKADLCEGCHGNQTGNAPRSNSGATMEVGTTNGDHPIDVTIVTPGPTIDRWFKTAGDTTRQERTAAADTFWPHPNDGTYTHIICTSCHSAHRAQSGKKLIRAGWLTPRGGVAVGWCNACHGDASPAGHHSHDANYAQSQISCTNCHGGSGFGGVGTGSLAHNGFNFNTFSGGNNASQLCNGCHLTAAPGTLGDDPVRNIRVNFTSPNPLAVMPANHLGGYSLGTYQSHYLGTFTDNAANSIQVKRNSWSATDNAFSKYGNNGGADTHGLSSDPGTLVVCESCHSVLHNVGASQAGAAATGTSGYTNNLLLEKFQDDGNNTAADQAIGSGLCVACHNTNNNGNAAAGPVADNAIQTPADVPAGTHPMTGWTVTRAVDAGRTPTTLFNDKNPANGGYAVAATAPAAPGIGTDSTVSYPGVNAMDCDSCHKPHLAPINSTYNQTKAGGAGNARPVILESQAAANEFADFCQKCHAM